MFVSGWVQSADDSELVLLSPSNHSNERITISFRENDEIEFDATRWKKDMVVEVIVYDLDRCNSVEYIAKGEKIKDVAEGGLWQRYDPQSKQRMPKSR